MHPNSMMIMQAFEQEHLAHITDSLDVLDVGSYDVNGSYRAIFNNPKYRYHGLDMAAGPNVDIALPNPYDWSSIPTDKYDVLISGQAFEHAEFFWVTMGQMARVLKKGGLMCLVAPLGFAEHRYPVDCYRFHADGMVALARWTGLTLLRAATIHPDSLLIATKPYAGATQYVDLSTYKCVPEAR
jgi:SAM-dependent methyltransferase